MSRHEGDRTRITGTNAVRGAEGAGPAIDVVA